MSAIPAPSAAHAGPLALGRSEGSLRLLGWALFAMALVWFGSLDARHLLRSDEGRYAEIAREMFSSGNWVTIRYNGLEYFEKPPFHLWMTVLAYHAFGVGDWQARLWVAISGAGGAAAIALAALRWAGPRPACLVALVLLSAPSWNLGAHFNSLDMSISGALACALAALFLAQHPQARPGAQRGWMLVAWGAMGVAVLTKGLIGIVLPGLALVSYSLVTRDWGLWRRLHFVAGTVVLLVITAPWFVLISLRHPEFLRFFFIHEHWQRYTSTVHDRMAPWWYFLPQLLGGFAPWVGLAPRMGALLRAERRHPAGDASGSATQPGQRHFRPGWFCACWAGSILVFFSLSDSKLPGYILPVFPALAWLAAMALERLLAQTDAARWRRQIVGLLVLGLLGMAFGLLLAGVPGLGGDAEVRRYGLWLAGAFAVLAGGAELARRLNRRADLLPSVTAYALASFLASTVALLGHETLGRPASGVDLVPQIEAVLKPQMPIYSVRLLDHTLPFYLRHTTLMVEDADELAFGAQQEPSKWLPTLAAFEQAWTHGPPALALMSHPTYQALSASALPMTKVTSDERRVVVANFGLPPR